MHSQRFIRFLGHHALQWFYRVDPPIGREFLPPHQPLLIVSNHPNQLVDVLACYEAIQAEMALTGKATLFKNPFLGFILRRLGVLPLIRRQDNPDAPRLDNLSSFTAIHQHWAEGGAALLFPEGRSYTDSQMVPLKSGAARLALSARDEASIKGLKIVPVGLRYEKKWAARSRLSIAIAPLIDIDTFEGGITNPESVDKLTTLIAERLYAATLNFASGSEAKAVLFTAQVLAEQEMPITSLAAEPVSWSLVSQKSQRLYQLKDKDPSGFAALMSQANSLRAHLQKIALPSEHLNLSLGLVPALGFILKAVPFLLYHSLITLTSRFLHAGAFTAARFHARRSQDNAEPAMKTVLSATALVLLTYGLIIALALALPCLWLLLLPALGPLIGSLDLSGRDHFHRLVARGRTWMRLRAHPDLQNSLRAQIDALAKEALLLEGRIRQDRSRS